MATAPSKVDLSQTVCAIATPLGRGGLGIVRLTGPQAVAIADRVFVGRDGRTLASKRGFTIHYGHFREPVSGKIIDEVLVTIFRSPKSFTGDDLIEFNCHGGQTVLRQMIRILAELGAIMAFQGEFTLRAFLNGRIDLTEAEAVADIVDAKTEEAATEAVQRLQGRLGSAIRVLKAELIAALAQMEMEIDFTEEDLDPAQYSTIVKRLKTVQSRIETLIDGYRRGRILRDGFVVVLSGPPNVGKSTLFNRLAQDERAIVTDVPGTTRDLLREYINLDGWPVCLIDTAGMRQTENIVEKIGVERAEGAIRSADGVIWLVDQREGWEGQVSPASFAGLPIPWLIAVNKIDLSPHPHERMIEAARHRAAVFTPIPPVIGISAQRGDGVEELVGVIRKWIDAAGMTDRSAEVAINDRHRAALARAQQSLTRAREALASGRSVELAAFDARAAAVALGEIIGETTTEDVLGEIFSNFCIGK